MNWSLIIPFSIAILALVIFLIRRNIKDEAEFENQLKQDYHKTKDEEGDIDVEEKMH
ncbi:MAG: hypothetical protein ACM3H8_10095 [Sphingobacteriales bacterium]